MLPQKILILFLLTSQILFAAPMNDRPAVCYIFNLGKLKSMSPCILSSGYGAGGTYDVLRIGKRKYVAETSTCYDEKTDNNFECGTTLNNKEAIYYKRNLFYDVIVDSSLIDDDALSCYITKDKKTDICFK